MKYLIVALLAVASFTAQAECTNAINKFKQHMTVCQVGSLKYQDKTSVQCKADFQGGGYFQVSMYTNDECTSYDMTVNDGANHTMMLNQSVQEIASFFYTDASSASLQELANWVSKRPLAANSDDREQWAKFSIMLPTQKSVLLYNNYLASFVIDFSDK